MQAARRSQTEAAVPVLTLHPIVRALAQSRPIFHSEADFQHHLAWEIRQQRPDIHVRLEVPVHYLGNTLHVDLVLIEQGQRYAVELKYKPRQVDCEVFGERFHLKAQVAHDFGRYDFLKDVHRVERLRDAGIVAGGAALLLTNDPKYWNADRPDANDRAFHLHDGHEQGGDLAWAPATGAGTIRGREATLALSGRYPCRWTDYAMVPDRRYPRFRLLLIDVPPVTT